MGHKFLGFLVGCFQLLFAAIVLGLSIAAVRWQYRSDVPALNGYACFAGVFGCLAALIGFMALLIDALAGIVMICANMLAALFMLCGGIVSPNADSTHRESS